MESDSYPKKNQPIPNRKTVLGADLQMKLFLPAKNVISYKTTEVMEASIIRELVNKSIFFHLYMEGVILFLSTFRLILSAKQNCMFTHPKAKSV